MGEFDRYTNLHKLKGDQLKNYSKREMGLGVVSLNTFELSLAPLSNHGLIDNNEINYLYDNYCKIEEVWWSNFELIDYPIYLVLIGEAPLRFENYIYNNGNTNGSPFLPEKHIKHCLALLDKDIPPTKEENKRPASMNELGLLVLDMFPFAFNDKDTPKFSYESYYTKKGEAHLEELFLQSVSWHLSEKIEKINSKVNEKTAYAFRYKRNFDLQSNYDLKIFQTDEYLNFGSSGMHINKEKLYKFFK